MKFYNPFKPHIVKEAEQYFIRKLTMWGWMWAALLYRQNIGYKCHWTRSKEYKQINCRYNHVADARTDLGTVIEKSEKIKTGVIL